MTCGSDENPQVLVLDEFNRIGLDAVNLLATDAFMQQCVNRNVYLISATSEH